jgi:hypothetical protein
LWFAIALPSRANICEFIFESGRGPQWRFVSTFDGGDDDEEEQWGWRRTDDECRFEKEAGPLLQPVVIENCYDEDMEVRSRLRCRAPGASPSEGRRGREAEFSLATYRRLLRNLVTFFLLLTFLQHLGCLALPSQSFTDNAEKEEAKGESIREDPDRPVPLLDDSSVGEPIPLSNKYIQDELRLAKDSYVERLHEEYGTEYVDAIFTHQDIIMGRLALR